jgi:hypothetical protein
MKTKKVYSVLIALLISVSAFAAGPNSNPNLAGWAQKFWLETVAPLWPWIIAIVFLVTSLYNISDVTGDQKNYKGFFSKLGLFVGSAAAIMIVVTWLTTLSL